MTEYLLGIDNGGTLIKAVVFDTNGKEIASASVKTALITPFAGYTERDMDELWEKNCDVIKCVVEKAGIETKEIIGVSCTGHGKGLYLWGKDDKPAYNGIISTDARAHTYTEQWKLDGTADKVFLKTFQKILACQPVSLLRWFKDNKPEILDNTRWILSVKDYIRFKLTGEVYAEITDMSGTNLLNIKDVCYDIELLKEFGLEDIADRLPPLKYSSELCGNVSVEAAQQTGLTTGTAVSGGMFDIDACAVAMDVTDEDKICVIAGTWSINEYVSKTPVLNKKVMMNSLFCLPGYYLIEECSPTSAGNNEWFTDMFLSEEKLEAQHRGISVYKLEDEMVESVAPGQQNIIFLPYLFGSNYNPIAKASLIGMDSHHTRAEIIRAVFEGIVFCHMVHIEKLLLNRERPKAIRLAGGAANSRVWVQIFADVLQIPIEIVDTKELGALGAAMTAGVVSGRFKDLKAAAKSMVSIKYVVNPIMANVQLYKKKYQLYKKISQLLDEHWSEF